MFDQEDGIALQRGYQARSNIVERAILRQLSDASVSQSPWVRYRFECLAWLIAEGRLDIKVAIPTGTQNKQANGIYHEKIGIFVDSEDNRVAFNGSPNETAGGLINNFESIDVFMSWDDPHGRVQRKLDNFERLWSDKTEGLQVVDFPSAARDKLLEFKPYFRPSSDPESQVSEPCPTYLVTTPRMKIGLPDNLTLRWYQEKAIESLIANKGNGILSMATGSGKTITALAYAVRQLKETTRLFILISCPYQHLADQWADEAIKFGFTPLLAYQSRNSWESDLSNRVLDYNLKNRNNVVLITTQSTLITEHMQHCLSRIKGPALFIADEAHHLGATQSQNNLPPVFSFRVGLSATPERWFDDNGTKAIQDYFGPTVFEFSLEDAIKEGCLSKYYYYPTLVELNEQELEQYEALTLKIARLMGGDDKAIEDPRIEALLRQRANILNQASNKIPELRELIKNYPEIDHALFYCSPGQIDTVVNVLGIELGVRIHPFTVEEPREERRRLLNSFDSGEIQGLVAIRCLDEGVDVPATRIAFLMASSSNPREFIQRRGRVLRKAPGKKHAIIHDMITVASLKPDSCAYNIERNILKKELSRFKEFANSAENRFQANGVIWSLAKKYNLLDF